MEKKTCLLFIFIVLMNFFGWNGEAVSSENEAAGSPIVYAREKLANALTGAGYDLSQIDLTLQVDASGKELSRKCRRAEGFRIAVHENKIKIIGFDVAGVLYGALELANRVKKTGTLPKKLDFSDAPVMNMRGVCILLMKLGGYNYPITPDEFPFFYDKKLWLEYLDFLAENRFNYIALWNGHPFDYFVKLEKYPEAQQDMPAGVLEKNHDMLKWLCAEGGKRNIRFFFEFYNIHTSVYFQKAHDFPDEFSRPTPFLAEYTGYAIETFLREFPGVGLYVTLGEALLRRYAAEWMNEVILPAVKRSGASPPIFLRAWFIDLEQAKKIAGNYPDLYFERKYNVEMVADTLVNPENAKWAKLTGNLLVNIHMAANLEPFRWNPPGYIQKCLKSALRVGSNGLHLYPRKSWRWHIGCDKGEPEAQWKRDALWFRMWGRYAWNPDSDPVAERKYWLARLQRRFGSQQAAGFLLNSFETGADVLPAIQRLLWLGDDNHTVVAAGAKLIQLKSAEGCPFLPLSDVARLPEFLTAIKQGKSPEKKSPIIFLKEKMNEAEKALELARQGARAATRNQFEARRFESDARAVWLVSKYYYHKLQAVVAKELFDNGIEAEKNRQQFLVSLEASLEVFRELTELTDSTYESLSDVPARHPMRLKICPYHWKDLLPIYENEFAWYQQEMSQPVEASFFEPTLPGLAGIFYGDPGLKYPDRTFPADSLSWHWSSEVDEMGRNWSAEWFGFLKAPNSGKVIFSVRSDRGATLEINGDKVIDWTGQSGERSASVNFEKDEYYPIRIIYDHDGGETGWLTVQWSWKGAIKKVLARPFLFHSSAQERRMEEATSLLQDEK